MWLLSVLFVLLPCLVWGANTHGTPDQAKEMQAWFGDALTGYAVSGCLHGVPGSGLTTTTAACNAYVKASSGELVYVTQPTKTVGPVTNNSTIWIAVHRDLSTAVANWTRQTGTHYLWRASVTQPAAPTNGLIIAKVTTSGGNITASTFLGECSAWGASGKTVQVEACATGGSGTYADPWTGWESKMRWGDQSVSVRFAKGYYSTATTIAASRLASIEGNGAQIAYTGTGKALTVDTGLGASGPGFMSVHIRDLTIRSTSTATHGIYILDAAEVNLDGVRIEGRPAGTTGDGNGETVVGNTTAGIEIACTFPSSSSLVVSIHDSYIKSNKGDGIKLSTCNNINAIQITHNRIQGNDGFGIFGDVDGKSINIAFNDIEGNGAGAGTAEIKLTQAATTTIIGNYFEHTNAADPSMVELNGGSGGEGAALVQGNFFGGSAIAGVRAGQTTTTPGLTVTGNGFYHTGSYGVQLGTVATALVHGNACDSGVTLCIAGGFNGSTDVSLAGLGGGLPRNVTQSSSSTSLTNTVTETQMFASTIPGYAANPNSMLRVILWFSYTNNSGGNADLTLRFKFDGTTIATLIHSTIATNANSRGMRCEVEVWGHTTSQTIVHVPARCTLTAAGAGTTTASVAVGSDQWATPSNTTVTTTGSEGLLLTMTAEHSVANANITLNRNWHQVIGWHK